MSFFNIDNPFFRAVWKIMNLILLSMLWLICSLPIFTIGASTCGLYYAVEKTIKHDLGYSAQMFFRGFKASFKQSTPIWLVMLALCLLFSFDWTFFTNYGQDGHPYLYLLRYIFVVPLFLELVYFLYIFPYIARFQVKTKALLYNCTLLIIRHPLRLLAILFFLACTVFMVWFLPFLIFLAPAVFIWQESILMERTYLLYMSDEDKESERRRNTPGDPDED